MVLERLSSQMEKSLGVTAQQRLILRCIGEFPGIAAGRLAAILHVDAGTVSASLRRLAAKDLVRRDVDDEDKRRSTLRLTKAGAALARTLGGTVEGAVTRLLATSRPAEVDSCKATLAELAKHLVRSSDKLRTKSTR